MKVLVYTFYSIVLMFNQNIKTMENWVKFNLNSKGEYFVSDLGRIRIVEEESETIKLGSVGVHGYRVCLGQYVHHIVLNNFIERPDWAECINHKNGIKTDNRLENLEWSTYQLNNQHAYDIGIKKPKPGVDIELVYKIYDLKKQGLFVRDIVKLVPLGRDTIKEIFNGKNWKFEYKKVFNDSYKPTGPTIGQRHFRAIKEELVLKIYEFKKQSKTITEIQKELGLNYGTVKDIYNGKNWKHFYKQHFG